ncbi:MAG: enoyl-CoA hydratase-related protein, partial [Pseudomonadota bacterium]
MSEEVEISTYDHIIEITLNRPPANAINPAVSNAIHGALQRVQNEPDLRVGIITGTGDRIFCAGWDLKEIAGLDSNQEALDHSLDCPGGFAGITE